MLLSSWASWVHSRQLRWATATTPTSTPRREALREAPRAIWWDCHPAAPSATAARHPAPAWGRAKIQGGPQVQGGGRDAQRTIWDGLPHHMPTRLSANKVAGDKAGHPEWHAENATGAYLLRRLPQDVLRRTCQLCKVQASPRHMLMHTPRMQRGHSTDHRDCSVVSAHPQNSAELSRAGTRRVHPELSGRGPRTGQ